MAVHPDGMLETPGDRLSWLASLSARRSLLDRFANAGIGPAAADVAGHCVVDVGIGGIGVAGEERRSRHDLARLAVAALNHLEVEPGLLDLCAHRRRADRLDRRDLGRRRRCRSGVTQERVATPSTCTVQAPQSATPQPNFVPVMPSTSRNTQRSGVSPSTSTLCLLPLTSMVKAMASSPCLRGD